MTLDALRERATDLLALRTTLNTALTAETPKAIDRGGLSNAGLLLALLADRKGHAANPTVLALRKAVNDALSSTTHPAAPIPAFVPGVPGPVRGDAAQAAFSSLTQRKRYTPDENAEFDAARACVNALFAQKGLDLQLDTASEREKPRFYDHEVAQANAFIRAKAAKIVALLDATRAHLGPAARNIVLLDVEHMHAQICYAQTQIHVSDAQDATQW